MCVKITSHFLLKKCYQYYTFEVTLWIFRHCQPKTKCKSARYIQMFHKYILLITRGCFSAWILNSPRSEHQKYARKWVRCTHRYIRNIFMEYGSSTSLFYWITRWLDNFRGKVYLNAILKMAPEMAKNRYMAVYA